MSTPTIEIEASQEMQLALQTALLNLEDVQADLKSALLARDIRTLKAVLADVTRARCQALRYAEQQIRLPLPR